MKTVVLQSYRTHGVEAWVSRCLSSVKAWTERSGYAYEFIDNSIFDLCGPEYLARSRRQQAVNYQPRAARSRAGDIASGRGPRHLARRRCLRIRPGATLDRRDPAVRLLQGSLDLGWPMGAYDMPPRHQQRRLRVHERRTRSRFSHFYNPPCRDASRRDI